MVLIPFEVGYMSISLPDMIKRIDPTNTILFFGAGSSIPSGAPSVDTIITQISEKLNIPVNGYSLSEIASITEQKIGRRALISVLRQCFKHPSATGSLLNLPLYKWKNIYTTNYDQLIEQAYERKKVDLSVFTSNFDFGIQPVPEVTKLHKLHGSIEKDIVDGNQSRIIISEADYDNTTDYREALFDAFKLDLTGGCLVIIGYSLSDPGIKDIVTKAIDINRKLHNPSSINLVLYTEDENRASLYENRGINVSFGGIDDFFLELVKSQEPCSKIYTYSGNPLDKTPVLNSITIDVAHAIKTSEKNVSAMYQGWPATYVDIESNITFERSLFRDVSNYLSLEDSICAIILGPSGIGKTTFARQVVLHFHKNDYHCWEHKNEHNLIPKMWREVARELEKTNQNGVLLLDDAHVNLYELNNLIDLLVTDGSSSLKLLLTSTRSQWFPRVKTPNIFKRGQSFPLNKLDEAEVEKLLTLVDSSTDLKPLVENSFAGFSRTERKRRLTAKCESDTFVCLKNIFASEKFDDIVLREFAELDEQHREVYRLVSAMEDAGINVHRQLVVRILGIPAAQVSASLTNLVDIIHEHTISEREGIYGWTGRHPVIAGIVAKYKMKDEKEYYKLLENVIDHIVPSYDIEIRTIKQLCGFTTGISRFPNKNLRNKLLRKMISKAPGERIPRHRLIRYLIDINELEKAETEIRLFEHDFKSDGTVKRFKIILMLERSKQTPGILKEDRIAILEMAKDLAIKTIEQLPENKNILRTYCDVGIEHFVMTGNMATFDDAMSKMREAEEKIGDPDITGLIVKYERVIAGMEFEDNIAESLTE